MVVAALHCVVGYTLLCAGSRERMVDAVRRQVCRNNCYSECSCTQLANRAGACSSGVKNGKRVCHLSPRRPGRPGVGTSTLGEAVKAVGRPSPLPAGPGSAAAAGQVQQVGRVHQGRLGGKS